MTTLPNAYVREEKKWIEWDDETATPVSWETVAGKEAYILFWERKDEKGSEYCWEVVASWHEEPKGNNESGDESISGEDNAKELCKIEERMNIDEKDKVSTGRKRRLEISKKLMSELEEFHQEGNVKRYKIKRRVNIREKTKDSLKTRIVGRWNEIPSKLQERKVYNPGDTPKRTMSEENAGKKHRSGERSYLAR